LVEFAWAASANSAGASDEPATEEHRATAPATLLKITAD
jgi:hypothetical protein